ncbi:MAG: fibronectin type III domain-containing protein [Labilithrix sp.]|nr:fibronectin type III domain-containing protein [Labilithrix sp.]
MSVARSLVTWFGIAVGLGGLATACAEDDAAGGPDADTDAPFIDAGRGDGGRGEDDGGADDAANEAAPPDTTPPDRVADLAATAVSHASVKLTWTAPADDSGSIAGYELRYATTPITTLDAFLAATSATPPSALASGAAQTVTVPGLTPETEYHFAIRARDAAGNFGELSSDVAATTKARAALLISEIAPVNVAADGGDFVELVATAAGSVADLEIRHSTAAVSALLYKLGPLDVAVGDRIVVHVVGQGPAGFAQEDATGDKASSTEAFASPEAFDVYSAVSTGLVSTNSLISVMDGAAYQDAVPYSERSINASTAAMTAFANAHAAGAWSFSSAPVDSADDCATLLEVVNARSPAGSLPPCGGYPSFLASGSSLQRNGVVDTNTRADFFVAAQTRGAANAPFCATEGAKLAITEVNPNANLVELTVTEGGSLRGFTVRRDPRDGNNGTLLSTLTPICGATDDVIVLHLGAPSGTMSETTSKDELPSAVHPGFYDGAWDVASTSGSSSLSLNTSLVIAVRDPRGDYVEAAAFSNMSSVPTDGGAYHGALALAQGLGLWLPATCGGVACTNATTPTARDLAASWNGVGATALDNSCRRASATSATEAASWSVGPSSFGQ